MLAADKLLLQSNVKQRSIELREKELKLFNSNFSAVGTQAAIMAGFTLTSFVEIDLPPEKHVPKVWPIASPRPRTPARCPPVTTRNSDRLTGAVALFRDDVDLRKLRRRGYGHLCDCVGWRQGVARQGWLHGFCGRRDEFLE